MAEKPNCYACRWRRDLSGDAHSECVHPATEESGGVLALVGLADGGRQMGASKTLNIKANAHGFRMGWFLWPVNFDPVWLEECTGFEKKEA